MASTADGRRRREGSEAHAQDGADGDGLGRQPALLRRSDDDDDDRRNAVGTQALAILCGGRGLRGCRRRGGRELTDRRRRRLVGRRGQIVRRRRRLHRRRWARASIDGTGLLIARPGRGRAPWACADRLPDALGAPHRARRVGPQPAVHASRVELMATRQPPDHLALLHVVEADDALLRGGCGRRRAHLIQRQSVQQLLRDAPARGRREVVSATADDVRREERSSAEQHVRRQEDCC
mmetsp:Transcript_126712/g.364491  ORF Transcript_126712/g.364491 Transcript_126712/m.364491 type:complete len:237 (+) Transcript_126712:301-1011(+)